MTPDEQRLFRLATEHQSCFCDDGVCRYCDGEGELEHECDCDFCEIDGLDCFQCEGSGKCRTCKGSGSRLLNASELQQAGFTKSGAREIVKYRDKARSQQ